LRLTRGQYLIAKQSASGARFAVATGDDGLPVIRVALGMITSRTISMIAAE